MKERNGRKEKGGRRDEERFWDARELSQHPNRMKLY